MQKRLATRCSRPFDSNKMRKTKQCKLKLTITAAQRKTLMGISKSGTNQLMIVVGVCNRASRPWHLVTVLNRKSTWTEKLHSMSEGAAINKIFHVTPILSKGTLHSLEVSKMCVLTLSDCPHAAIHQCTPPPWFSMIPAFWASGHSFATQSLHLTFTCKWFAS